MKVVYVRNAVLGRDHYITSQIETIKALRGRNIDAKLIAKGDKKEWQPYLIPIGVPFDKNRYFLLKLFFYLPYYLIKNKIDFLVLDEHTIFSAISSFILKGISHVKIILDVRTIPIENEKMFLKRKLSYLLARLFCNGAIFITKETQKICEEEYGLIFKNTEIVTSAANENIFKKNIKIEIEQNIVDILKNHFVILYHGSISPNRGVTLILDAINKLKNKIPDLIFLSVSDNNDLLKNYCSEHGLNIEKQTLFINSQPNTVIPQFIKLSDMGIIPLLRIKWWEASSPLKLMEYMSMEIPIVLSDIKAHINVIPLDSDFAVYFNPDKKGDLSEKILYAYENIKKLKENSWKGRQIILENFSWNKIAEKLILFFQDFDNKLTHNYKRIVEKIEANNSI